MLEIIYTSAAVVPFTDREIETLLARARVNNARQKVTGMLLYDRGSFLQVIEGEEATVRALFEKIAVDARHRRVIKLLESATEKRSFESWTMGLVSIERFRASNPPGLTDFVKRDFSIADFARTKESDKARQILHAFREGRWRTYVEG